MSQESLTARAIALRVKELPPWPSEFDGWFSRSDWRPYIDLALELQRAADPEVERGLTAFNDGAVLSTDAFSEQSKPYILLRVMFDIPDRIPDAIRAIREEKMLGTISVPVFATHSPFRETDSTPVAWTQDGPVLTAQLGSVVASGPPYSPSDEYRFFKTYFKFREQK